MAPRACEVSPNDVFVVASRLIVGDVNARPDGRDRQRLPTPPSRDMADGDGRVGVRHAVVQPAMRKVVAVCKFKDFNRNVVRQGIDGSKVDHICSLFRGGLLDLHLCVADLCLQRFNLLKPWATTQQHLPHCRESLGQQLSACSLKQSVRNSFVATRTDMLVVRW